MAESKQIDQLKKLEATRQRNVDILEGRVASYGPEPPLDLVNALESEKEKLREIKDQLAGLLPPPKREEPLPAPAEPNAAKLLIWGGIALVAVLVIGGAIFFFQGTDVPLTRVVRTASEIHIDGLLDESAWSEVDSLTYAVHPAENGSTTATVRFLWDDDYLYAGFDVNDTQVEMADLSTLWDSDSISLLLHDGGIAEHRQSLGEKLSDDMAVQLKPGTTLNEPADTDTGYTIEMRIKWKESPSVGRRIPADLLSVDHDANPGAKYDAPGTVFSKLSWDGDGEITSAGASLLLVDGKRSDSD
jgi:hypothetical protein